MRVAFILPPREVFAPDAAGAISMVVQRLCAATPHSAVFGLARAATYPGIAYHGVANGFALIRSLRRLQPEFIDVHQQPRLALTLSLLCPRSKILLFLHNDPLSMRGLKSAAGRRLMLARMHRVVCVSAYLQARYMTNMSGRAPDILPNPLTLAELPAPAANRDNTILFAGRIVTDKAPDVFAAACAMALPKLPGWQAAMIGGDRFGPASPQTAFVDQVRGAAKAAGISFAGSRPHYEVLAAMACAAIVVVPSRWPEPFGLTALEAIASGAALIATPQGGLPEVAGRVAIYVKRGDATALAEAILQLAQDEPRRLALAEAGRQRARQFDTAIIAAQLENLRIAPALL